MSGRLRFMGIDPGLRLTGYACLEGPDDPPRIVEAGVFRLAASKPRPVSDRLMELHADLAEAIQRLRPDVVAVESFFVHPKHPATSITMAHARGVVLLAIRQAGVQLMEFKPNLVKRAMTAHGLASKGQMQRAVQSMFDLPEPPSPPDVADAIAIALCAARRHGM
ncbi:MAG: crossover junction endodeoxyribonuclease RuvC [Phycisphaerales bacterium]